MHISNSIQKKGSMWGLRFLQQWPWRWHEVPCCLTDIFWCFRLACCLHLQGKRWANWERWHYDWAPKFSPLKGSMFFLCPLYSYWFAQRLHSSTLTPCVCTTFFTHTLFFCSEDRSSMFFWNANKHLPDYMAPHLRKQQPSRGKNHYILLYCDQASLNKTLNN